MAIQPANTFPGFSEDALQFLKKLAKNNKREWFLPRKAVFEEQLQKPMAELMLVLGAAMNASKIPLAAIPKSVFRIYRDIRFSADKRPYKTHIAGALYRRGKKDAPGVLYVHFAPDEQFIAAGFWQPDRAQITNWRLAIQANPKEFLAMLKRLRGKKLELSTEDTLQRMPRGFQTMEGTPAGEFLKLQSFVVSRKLTVAEALSADLPKIIARFALDARPLLEYGWALPEAKPAVLLD